MFTGTKNFTPAEVACKCGCGMLPEADFMDKVQIWRDLCGFPLPVNSGARCAKHNNEVSHTGETGPHTKGRAIDVGVAREQAFHAVRCAYKAGMTGIGIKQHGDSRYIHVDDLPAAPDQPRPTMWSYP